MYDGSRDLTVPTYANSPAFVGNSILSASYARVAATLSST